MGESRASPSVGHCYGPTNLTGQAAALLGDNYSNINIERSTVYLTPSATVQHAVFTHRTERHNRVFPTYTIETINTVEDDIISPTRGKSSQIELCWEKCENLGAGVFGVVHREECHTGTAVDSRAVKVLNICQLETFKIDYKKEIGALSRLSKSHFVHRFIEFHTWYTDNKNLYLAMEYISRGDLRSHIRGGMSEIDAKQIGYQVLDGIQIMHRLDITHRDIKPANIFVVRRRPTWWVKIGDFSICKSTATEHTTLHTSVGTEGYQAPEITGFVDTEKPGHYNSKCDVWSFGCLVYEMLTSRLPFTSRALVEYCDRRVPFPSLPIQEARASSIALGFVQSLLTAEPRDRPTAEEAFSKGGTWFLLDEPTTLTRSPRVDLEAEAPSTNDDGLGNVGATTNPLDRDFQAMSLQSNLDVVPGFVSVAPKEAVSQQLQPPVSSLQTAAANSSPTKVEPLRFKDALGREYSFPWERCYKWEDMENLIHQAFAHIDKIGPHVLQGHYDLIGPEREIIMADYWEDAIYPGMVVTMMLWPIPYAEPDPIPETPPVEPNPEIEPPPPLPDYGYIDLDALLAGTKKCKIKKYDASKGRARSTATSTQQEKSNHQNKSTSSRTTGKKKAAPSAFGLWMLGGSAPVRSGQASKR